LFNISAFFIPLQYALGVGAWIKSFNCFGQLKLLKLKNWNFSVLIHPPEIRPLEPESVSTGAGKSKVFSGLGFSLQGYIYSKL